MNARALAGFQGDPSTGGKNAGPQPPVTAYTPDGEAVALSNVSDMKAFYAQNCIAWPYSSDQKAN